MTVGIWYEQDFLYKGASIHFETKNDSFVRICLVYKRMGVKNAYWPLALIDKDLKYVDPWDPNLSDVMKARIARECKLNPIYFFREVQRIPAAGDKPIPYQATRGNMALIWSFFNDVDIGLVQPRQTGKTYGTQAIVNYMMCILAENIDIGLFTKDSALVQDNTSRLKELKSEGIPSWMVIKSPKDWDRKEGVSYALKKNYYKTFTSANDERSANKLGRGATINKTVA
jgi:hypothetical protein